MSFIFGGNTGISYEEMQRRRALAERLSGAANGAPRNIGEGWSAIGAAIGSAISAKQAQKAEAAGKAGADDLWSRLWGDKLGSTSQSTAGGSMGGPVQPYAAKQTPEDAIGDDAMKALGRSPMGPGGLDFGAVEQQYGLPAGYLHRTGQIESGLNPNAKNPNSSAGGLFQFIDSTAADYGLQNKFDPMQATDAAGRLARDNAGYLRNLLGRDPTAAELYLAHQQGAGGAGKLLANPGARAVDIVGADAVRLNGGNMDMTAGEFANLWLGKFGDTGVQTQNAVPMGQQGATSGNMTMSAAGGGTMTPVQANPMDQMDPALLMEALSNPYMAPEQKSVIGTLLQQKLAPPDPMADIELQKAQLELQQMQNPQPGYRTLTADEAQGMGLPPGAYQVGPDNKVYQIGGGGTNVTVNNGEGNSSKFTEEADKAAAARFNDYTTGGATATQMVGDLQALAELAPMIGTGKGAEFSAAIGPYAEALGVDIGGLGEAQAFKSIVDRLAPQMRPVGGGSSSDTDVRLFLNSLPRLGNTPEGNQIIMQTLSALQQHKIAAAEIAAKAYLPKEQGGLTWQEAETQIRALGNPYEAFNQFNKGRGQDSSGTSGAMPSAGDVVDGYRFKGGDPADQNSWEQVQ